MSRRFGSQSMVAPLRRVLVRPPGAAFGSEDWQRWHYASRIDLERARTEHDDLVEILRTNGAEILVHDEHLPDHADAVFVHDPALVTDHGAVVLRMGKELRRGEEEAIEASLKGHGVPTLGRLTDDARAEGGDLLWLDESTLAVGLGFRTNVEGLRQLDALLSPLGVAVLPVSLPYFKGPEACLHLMSIISLVDDDLAVVYLPLMPVPFLQELERREIEWVEAPEQELATMGTNVLALAPRHCLMLEGNPVTRSRLEAAGCTVLTYRGNELSRKAEGGATCLTRPVLRAV